jgi:hypothetical protein
VCEIREAETMVKLIGERLEVTLAASICWKNSKRASE